MMKHRLKRAISLLCAFAICVGLLPAGALAVQGPATPTGGINGYQATMQADVITSGGWENAFVVEQGSDGAVSIGGTYRSSALNGKIWADKSVAIDNENKEFDVTFSTLGQTFASRETSQSRIAFDVMFVLDTSGSMGSGNDSKAADAVSAVNTAMKSILDGTDNQYNRVGITTFGDNMTQDNVVLPLDHYTHPQGSENYITYEFTWDGFGREWYASLTAQNSSNHRVSKSFSMDNTNTYTQGGIAWGINAMMNSEKANDDLVHYPVVILLTDGEPNRYASSWNSVSSTGSWCDADSSGGATGGQYTVRTANYYKELLTQNYKGKYPSDTNIAAKFFTIGQGITQSNDYAVAVLNPTAENIEKAGGRLASSLFPSRDYDNQFSYADGAYFGEMSEQELNEAFESIFESLGDMDVNTDVGESTGGRNNVTYYETLGDGVRFTGDMTLTVPTYEIVDNAVTGTATRTYTFVAKAVNTIALPDDGGTISAGDTMNMSNAPAYLENGGTITFEATEVAVDEPDPGPLDPENKYDKAAQENLSITVRQISSGQRQMQVDIPPELMAYNVLSTTTVDDHSTSTYYQSNGPLQLTYGVQMREDKTAGDWLVSAPAQSYVSFFPSSAQTTEGIYDMPYYWRGGQFEQDDPQAEKTGGSVQGSSGYIYAAEKNQNNEVRIYLGNNGLYKLTGKDLTFHLFWDDANNQDGKRPERVTVQLYREVSDSDSATEPTEAPTAASPVGYPVSLNQSNLKDGMWEHVFSDQTVYSTDSATAGRYLRYWLKITPVTDYTDTLYATADHNNGVRIPASGAGDVWYCFSVDTGLMTNAELDVKLSHTPETVDYTVEKIWQGDIGQSATMQLVANGQPATEEVVGNREDLVKTLTDANEVKAGSHTWTYTWENLPKYSNGEEITYRAAETAVEANEGVYYQTSYDFTQTEKTTVTNTSQDAEQAKMNFTARVFWDDADNVDDVRPNSVTLKLVAKANGQNVPPEDLTGIQLEQTVSSPNWTVVWNNLPRFTSAHEQITYSIVELKDGTELSVGDDLNDNYKVSDYSSFGDGYMTVTNTHDPATVDIKITKAWDDNSNQDGIRPSSVSGVLYKKVGTDGAIQVVRTFSISNGADNAGGTITLSNLPKNEGGQAITYYVSEHAVNGYKLETNATGEAVNLGDEETPNWVYPVNMMGNTGSITLTNSHTPATIDYEVTLVWNDHDNEDNSRPTSVTVTVDGKEITLPVQNGQIQAPTGEQYKFVSDSKGGGTLTVTLPMYENGKLKDYSSSVTAPDKYTSSITGVGSNRITYTLSYTSQPVNLGFTKVWSGDDAVKDDMRPNENAYARYLTLKQNNTTYSATPTVTDNHGNTYTVTYNNLPKRDNNGVAYTYTVTESKVPNYTAQATSDVTVDGSGNATFKLKADASLTNTYAQETYAPITVTKQWVGDADGQRPETDDNAISINLYKSEDTSYMTAIGAPSVTDNDDGTWTYTWNNVPSTNADGSAISYVAYESKVPAGYTATVRQVDVINGTASGSIINTLNSGAVTTGTLTITKSWQDDEQYTDKRPNSLSFNVYGDYGETNDTHEITRNVTMTPSGGNWTTNVAGLPVTVNGQPVTYTVEELNVPAGYTVENGNAVTFGEETTAAITVTNTYTPDTWTLTYHANGGTDAPTDDTVYSKTNATATVKGQGDMTYGSNIFLGWTTDIHGVVVDADNVPAALYKAADTLTMTGDATLYAVWAVDSNGDNTPDYQQKTITVNVVWQDDGNRCGIRPNMIEFKLNGEKCTVDLENSTDVRVTTNDGNTRWIYEIVVDADAAISEGSITAVNVTPKDHADQNDTTGYTSSVAYADDVFTITLTHTPETTSHYVTKNWTYDNQPIFTADKATIHLLGNGKDVAGADDITFTPSTAGGSEDLGWDTLPKYEGGQLITYQAIETSVKDTDGNEVSNQYDVTYQWTNERTTITNTYNQKRSVTLVYQWDDNGDAAGKRPDSVTIQLYYTIADDTTTRAAGDPQLVTGSSQTISENEDWSVTWNDLPVHDINNTGKVIQYEAHVTAYTVAGQSYPVDLFDDPEDTALGQSGYSFDVAVFGMDSVFIMNSAMDTTTDFKVTKQWNDANNAYSTRPDTIWVNLMQDGVIYQSAEVTKDNWTHTWTNLPAYPTDGTGVAYTYTVSEIPVPGYTSTVAGNTITNALDALSNPDDPDNQLTVTFVYNNGQQNTTQTVSFGGTATSITPTWDGHVFKGWYTDNGTFVNPYDFTDPVTDNITLYAKWVSIHDGTEDKDDHHFVTFVYENASATNNGTAIAENTKIQVACGSDYTFTAAADSGYILNTPTKVGSATLVANGNNSFTLDNITSDITVTITATRQTTGGSTGGGGGGGTTRPELEKGDHFAYIVGYEDGTVRPENNITRAEVATIFFRLLTEESREAYYSEVNAFTDVSDGDWYNNAISTLVNADIITGYTDGSFRPDAYITRAELAAIASRFDDISGGETRLTDIDGHWAEELISSAYNKGWVDGYPDGSFRPDQNITRAEVMTLVNRVLERAVDQDGMLDDMVTWSDNQPSSWYYEAVQEATNSHDYSRDEGETLETWTEITPPRDWTELEK